MQASGPSNVTTISGTVVGILDPTQATRLLSSPGSILSFATFHPRTASATSRKLSTQDELCSQKRVVIETLVSGENFWRWVPRAKGVDHVDGEGLWPRVINICGQLVECSQEQWDIYKLDPAYDCVVRPHPELTTITRREVPEMHAQAEQVFPDGHHHKRRVNGEYDSSLPQAKKRRPVVVEEEDERKESSDDGTDSEEEAVEEMIIDDTMPGAWAERKKQFRSHMQKDRKARREKAAAKTRKVSQAKDITSDLSMIDLTLDETPTPTQATPSNTFFSDASTAFSQDSAPPTMNSAGTSSSGGTAPFFFKRSAEPMEADTTKKKRLRTHSPPVSFVNKFHPLKKEEWKRKRDEYQRTSLRKTMDREKKRKEAEQRALEESIRAAAQAIFGFNPPPMQSNGHTPSNSTTSSQPPPQPSQDVKDPISLEEKIRRMAEINAYEEARVAKELERQRAEQAAEDKRRKHEEQHVREKVRAEREARERAAEEEKRIQRQKEEQERRKRDQARAEYRKKVQQQHARWSYGLWTTQRALERYKLLSEAFDTAQYTVENPITFFDVPWPVLHSPSQLTIEDVDWSAVEAFFQAIRPHMRSQDYKVLVEKSHRRFHPDRWRARRVLQGVQDDEVKACLEVAANTVAQALTPLWREVKSS